MAPARILPLSDLVANQIAAGEVIERPASVVKELVENAIDAGADKINVEIGFAGFNLIKVSDNGFGILTEDLPLAIAPHATSKIAVLSDLEAINTLGFRGEALASIASISRLIIFSKTINEENGGFFDAQKMELKSCARNPGTTVEVHDIFFNAPVRKRFLKSATIEFQAIESLLKRIAMSTPKLGLQLVHNGHTCWEVNSCVNTTAMRSRISCLLGKKFIQAANHLCVEHAGMKVEGWFADGSYQRSQSDGIWLFVNGRVVKDKLLLHAIRQAYSEILNPGRHPSCLVYLTIEPSMVDVNVHPCKIEVRFQEPRLVHDFLLSQISKIFKATESLNINWAPATNSLAKERNAHIDSPFGPKNNSNTSSNYPPQADEIDNYVDWSFGQTYNSNPFSNAPPQAGKRNNYVDWPSSPTNQIIPINQEFAICLKKKESYLLNLKALYEEWQSKYLLNQSLPWERRALLVPITYRDFPEDYPFKENLCSLLDQFGIECTFLNHSLLIRTIPQHTGQLPLNYFFNLIFSKDELSKELIMSTFQKSLLSQNASIEDHHFLNYLKGRLNSDPIFIQNNPFIKPLDVNKCCEIFNV